ncbi:hypothetical protein E8E11_008692 [Didymella keratinophila]|nr:hypothetical protein E8E11_008692 [Didymella keratinophila]
MESANNSVASIYIPHPLDLKDVTQIRLLEPMRDQACTSMVREIGPCDDLPELRMKLMSYRFHVVSLKDAPHFTALSYVWGSPELTKTIGLEGQEVTIRRNLWDFLSYYEPKTSPCYLWIDALCINQSCIEERNHQVAIMGQIYRRADMVIAWLGLGYEEELIQIPSALEEVYTELGPDMDYFKDVPETPLLSRYLGAVSQSDYWSRLWMVQEYILSSSLLLCSGRGILDIDDVFIRLDIAVDSSYWNLFHDHLSKPVSQLIHARYWKGDLDFWYASHNLIDRFKDAKCADVRDHVFGLMGLFEEEELETYPITVDYSQSITTLFFQIFERRRQQFLAFGDANHDTIALLRFAETLREAFQLPHDFGSEDGIPSRAAHLKAEEMAWWPETIKRRADDQDYRCW